VVVLLFVGIAIGLLIAGGMAAYRAVTATPEERASHRHPLHVTVDRVHDESWAIAFRDDAPLVPALDDLAARGPDDSRRVLREHGGIDFRATHVRLHLRTHGEEVVTVREIAAVVVRRDPSFAGRLIGVDAPDRSGTAALVFDLDADDPAAGARAALSDNPIVVRHDEPVDVFVTGITASAYCQWRIHLETEVSGEHVRMTVGDRDLPFETTGSERAAFPRGFEAIA
jgi:hypothetical protein